MLRFCFLATLCLLLLGCGRVQNERFTGAGETDTALALEVQLAEARPIVGTPARLRIRLTSLGTPVTGAAVQVEGNMTHAGMEPLFMAAAEVAPGEYEAALDWTMGGEWFLRVRATLPDGGGVVEQVERIEVATP